MPSWCCRTFWVTKTISETWTSRSRVPADGVTALQMDIKIDGITREIMETAPRAGTSEGRLHILDRMGETLEAPRADMSMFAPRIISFKIHPEKIRDVIGKGGSVIRSLTEETGATIDVSDDGTVKIASVDAAAGLEAKTAHRADHGGCGGWFHLRGPCCEAHGLRRIRQHPPGP